MERQTEDVRFNYPLASDCAEDRKKLCPDEQPVRCMNDFGSVSHTTEVCRGDRRKLRPDEQAVRCIRCTLSGSPSYSRDCARDREKLCWEVVLPVTPR